MQNELIIGAISSFPPSKAGCTLRAKSEANNRNMTSKQQRTGANILFLRYLFASLRYFAPSVHAP